MSRNRTVTTEQGRSLAASLQHQGIAHGDAVHDVELVGVGVDQLPTGPHLAFCPASLVDSGTVKRASPAERKLAMPIDARLSKKSRLNVKKAVGDRRGFATIHCKRIWSNGKLNVEGVTVVSFTPVDQQVDVRFRTAYERHLATAST